MNDDETTPVDPTLFESSESSFTVKYTEDVSAAAAVYLVKQWVQLVDYGLSAVHPTPFQVKIVDPCDKPISVSPSSPISDAEYTITAEPLSFQLAEFVSDPAWCSITYSYTVDATDASVAISFDQLTRTFMISQADDLSLSGPISRDHTVRVIGESGSSRTVTGSQYFLLRLKNPCIDPAFVTVEAAELPGGLEYALYDFDPDLGFKFVHEAFTVKTEPFIHELCGDIAYKASFAGEKIGSTSPDVRYDEVTRTFEVYSE